MIRINGTDVTLGEGVTIERYLAQNQYHPTRVAVERNGEIVPRTRYTSTVLQDGDEVEIVQFVGGG